VGVGSEEQGRPWPPWIFKHGTNRGLKVLFSAFFAIFRYFFPFAPPGRYQIVLFFGNLLFANFWSFFRCPPLLENFLPDALVCGGSGLVKNVIWVEGVG